ncbi:MAG: hypothetical protein ACOCRC_04760 [Halodesulfurarchaeum sp.]
MTRKEPDTSDLEITTEAAFDSALQTLLHAAVAEGLDPRGAWEYRNDGEHPDLEVLISELAKEHAGD